MCYVRDMDSREIPEGRLYNDLAWLWQVMSPQEDYVEEAACWRKALWESLGPGRHHVLELGVGGGHNLSHLTEEFDATAVDLSPQMLKRSLELNPGVEHIVGDMRLVRTGRTYDAVLIHDAISCMTSGRDVASVLTTAAAHLEPGGVLIVAPEYFSDHLSLPSIACHTHTANRIELACMEYTHDPDPTDTALEILLTYIIKSDAGVQIEHDRMHVGVFSHATWRRLMHDAGFETSERCFHLSAAKRDYTLFIGLFRGQ